MSENALQFWDLVDLCLSGGEGEGLVVDTLHFAGKNAKNSLQILDPQKLSSLFPLSCNRVNPITAIYL